MNYIILAVLVAVGLYDLWLVYKDKPTLSQQYQRLFPKKIDMAFFVVGLIILCLLSGLHPVLRIITGAFWGHVTFPNKETYKK